MNSTLHAGYLPGCIGRVAQLHAEYYSRVAGFGVAFEAKVAREMSAFCERLQSGRDGLWLALDDSGQVQGAIAIDGEAAQLQGALLRWFITSDLTRGSGVGGRLLAEALAFCERAGHPRVYLWTFEGLAAARHLYEKAGFRLVLQQRGAQWGTEVSEQRFER